MQDRLDAVLFDIGGTLVEEDGGHVAVEDLVVRPRANIAELLDRLSGMVKVGAVTNTAVMREVDVRALLAPSGLSDLLEVVITSVDVGVAKPSPRPLLVALDALDLRDPSRVLYVGNRETDAAAAAAAGMPYVNVDDDEAFDTAAAVEAWAALGAGRRFFEAAARLTAPDAQAEDDARARQAQLTKPAGALGRLETLSIQLAGMAGQCPPPVCRPATVVVFAADHGVHAEGVSPWPQDVTALMVRNFAAGGAAINVLARQAGADVLVVDVGIAGRVEKAPGVVQRRIRAATANLATGAAMTTTEARRALDVGVEMAEVALGRGARCLVTGEMGIGNTTASAAIIGAFTGRPGSEVTGRGTGIDDEAFERKRRIVDAAITRADGLDPVAVLAECGGLEIAALAGLIVGGATARCPVVIDGLIALAGAVVAERLCPGVLRWCIAGHRSTEPGATVALECLGLEPLIDLGLRLGEGTGAALALPMLESAARLLAEMATFADLGLSPEA